MKKALRFLLILILLVLVVVVVAGILAPKETNIEASTTISAPKEVVWEQMVKFKNWGNWSYWHKMDSNQTITYNGVDGEPGSSYSWKGEKTGEGTMTNKSLEGTKMNYELVFVQPWQGTADGYLMAEDAGDGTVKATWTYHSVDGFISRAVGYLFMNKMLKSQFEEGLANLKTYAESHKDEMPAGSGNINIQEVDYPGHTYAGIRQVVKWEEMEKFFPATYEALGKTLGPRIAGPAMGIYYTWDTVKHETDVFAGFTVSDDKPAEGASIVTVPAGKAYMVSFVGDPSKVGPVHEMLGQHAGMNGKEVAYVLEEYVVGGQQEKDMNKWVTNIYYILK